MLIFPFMGIEYSLANNVFQNFDMKLFESLSNPLVTDYMMIMMNCSKYGCYKKSVSSIIGNDPKRLSNALNRAKKEYQKKFSEDIVDVDYDDWYDEINIIVSPSFGNMLKEWYNNTTAFLQKYYLSNVIGVNTLIKAAKDKSIPDYMNRFDAPNGRVHFIGSILNSKEALPALKKIALHDYSMPCRYEAMKGVYLQTKDAAFFEEMIKTRPKDKDIAALFTRGICSCIWMQNKGN